MYVTAGVCTGLASTVWFITWFIHRVTGKAASKVEQQADPEENGGHTNTANTVDAQEYNRSKSLDEVTLDGSQGQRSRCSTMLHL